ncbi:beta-lactamase-like protein [Podospora fimiseda]|uniref:Beta-lactamase-like protein n=1 Tax=Podospora fimiseda TaxID=252190 RepID=A0AAN7C0D3_9PEZI|nr:beta-lactamase-like protein [Podospora fimiseda]
MSTFNGLVAEFPDIRVDFFRSHPDLRPPLACFLSHIHSDHLAGLENLRSPFVYCSAATKEMLLRLERFPCRINYAKGILEARIQRYRHLRNLLKPLPLETQTVLELEPGNNLQVTLFDANHCPGSVMFLFEGQGKAAIYTGDVRSEPWFVNAITRSPSMIEYSTGLKTLDTIYFDTSFIDDLNFPTKSEGIRELLQKVSKYPENTIFHFQAWTYGYEDVWIALSKALQSKIHVDEYKGLIYSSLVSKDKNNQFGEQFHLAPEAPALVGFMCGNTYHPGCLTTDENVRIHSCEKGNYCDTVKNSPVVWIQPIITRLPNGQDIAEVGIGGGGDDLEREVELDYMLPEDIEALLKLVCDDDGVPEDLQEQFRLFLLSTMASGRKIPLDMERSEFGEKNETKLSNGLQAIVNQLQSRTKPSLAESPREVLPTTITFPYSRHASFPELCNLVDAFKPKDVWPCTVDVRRWLHDGISIEGLFGEFCSDDTFRHDQLMLEQYQQRGIDIKDVENTQATTASDEVYQQPPVSISPSAENLPEPTSSHHQLTDATHQQPPMTNPGEHFSPGDLDQEGCDLFEYALEVRMNAFHAILENAKYNAGNQIGLLSTTDNHTYPEWEFDYTGPGG